MPCVIDLFRFLKARLPYAAFFGITVAVVAGVSYLAGQDASCARYMVLLISFFFLLFLCLDGLRYFRHRRILRGLPERFYEHAAELSLPEPSDALEADYSRLLRELAEAFGEMKRKHDRARNESLEYYTLWVHQIKTPIAALSLVLERMDGEAAGVIRQELFKIERYADMALRYVKLSDIASDLVIETCRLEDVVRDSVRKFGIPIVYKKLAVEIGAIEATVLSDRRWLAFILEQLISNAVKYTGSGRIRIFMEAHELAVEDSGIGIRAEDLPMIFAKGFTGRNGRMDGRASGIGLYLAKKAADALGVRIRVKSRIGEGTTVFLSFPESDGDMYR